MDTWEWLFVAGVFGAWSHLLGSGLYGWVYVGKIVGLDYCMVAVFVVLWVFGVPFWYYVGGNGYM